MSKVVNVQVEEIEIRVDSLTSVRFFHRAIEANPAIPKGHRRSASDPRPRIIAARMTHEDFGKCHEELSRHSSQWVRVPGRNEEMILDATSIHAEANVVIRFLIPRDGTQPEDVRDLPEMPFVDWEESEVEP